MQRLASATASSWLEHAQAILEITQRGFLAQGDDIALVARDDGKVPEEQFVMRDHIAVRAIVEVVHCHIGTVGAAQRFVGLL